MRGIILIGSGIALFIAAYVINSNPKGVYGFDVGTFLAEFGPFALIWVGVFDVWLSLRRSGRGALDAGKNVEPPHESRPGASETPVRTLKLWFLLGMSALALIVNCVGINSLILQPEVSDIPNPGLNIISADMSLGLLQMLTVVIVMWWPISGMIVFYALLSAKVGDEWEATIVWLLVGYPVATVVAGLISHIPAG